MGKIIVKKISPLSTFKARFKITKKFENFLTQPPAHHVGMYHFIFKVFDYCVSQHIFA